MIKLHGDFLGAVFSYYSLIIVVIMRLGRKVGVYD